MGTYNYIILDDYKVAFSTKLDEHTLDDDIIQELDDLVDEYRFCDLNETKTMDSERKLLNSQYTINTLCSEFYLKDYFLISYLLAKGINFRIVHEKDFPKDFKLIGF